MLKNENGVMLDLEKVDFVTQRQCYATRKVTEPSVTAEYTQVAEAKGGSITAETSVSRNQDVKSIQEVQEIVKNKSMRNTEVDELVVEEFADDEINDINDTVLRKEDKVSSAAVRTVSLDAF